jgi:hypothetical protein
MTILGHCWSCDAVQPNVLDFDTPCPKCGAADPLGRGDEEAAE